MASLRDADNHKSNESLNVSQPQLPTNDPQFPGGTVQLSGRKLVISLLIMGIATTSLMFVYWEQHTRPFRSLREAIGREFKHSRPNVEGGRQKGRGPWTLRISMKVDFPPTEDTGRAQEIANRILQLTSQIQRDNQYENIELNLIQFIPQEVAKTKTITWTAEELKAEQ